MKGNDMEVRPEDEGPHPADADEAWQESVYLAWRDPRTGIGGQHRIGNEQNRETANLWCGVYADSGERFRHNAEGVPLRRCERGAGLECGPQAMFHDGKDLRFLLESEDCRLDLIVQDSQGWVAWIEKSTNALDGRIYSDHYNGHCRVSGQASLAGRRYEIDAMAWRDHSWGPRHWDSIVCTRSLGCGFESGLTLSLLTFLGTDGNLMRRGYVARDGKRVPISEAELWVAIEEDGVSARGGALACTLEDGTRHDFDFAVTGGMMGVTRERSGFESIVRVQTAGESEGWGFLEINNNPRLGVAGPYAVLHDGLANGLTRRAAPLGGFVAAAHAQGGVKR